MVFADMKGGEVVPLAAKLGDTPLAVLETLNELSLTGSISTMDEVWLEAADGSRIRYRNVDRLRAGAS